MISSQIPTAFSAALRRISKRRTKSGKDVMAMFSVTRNCIYHTRQNTKCACNVYLQPPWNTGDRLEELRIFYEEMEALDAFDQEQLGIIRNFASEFYPREAIIRLFEPDNFFEHHKFPQYISVGVDPGLKQSKTGIVAIGYYHDSPQLVSIETKNKKQKAKKQNTKTQFIIIFLLLFFVLTSIHKSF